MKSAQLRHEDYILSLHADLQKAIFTFILYIDREMDNAADDHENFVRIFFPAYNILRHLKINVEADKEAVYQAVVMSYRLNGYHITNGVSKEYIFSW